MYYKFGQTSVVFRQSLNGEFSSYRLSRPCLDLIQCQNGRRRCSVPKSTSGSGVIILMLKRRVTGFIKSPPSSSLLLPILLGERKIVSMRFHEDVGVQRVRHHQAPVLRKPSPTSARRIFRSFLNSAYILNLPTRGL